MMNSAFDAFRNPQADPPIGNDEVLVVDSRAALRPAEMVERKLMTLLRGVPRPVSHIGTNFRSR